MNHFEIYQFGSCAIFKRIHVQNIPLDVYRYQHSSPRHYTTIIKTRHRLHLSQKGNIHDSLVEKFENFQMVLQMSLTYTNASIK